MLPCLHEFQRMGQECFLSSIVLAFINKLSLTKKTNKKIKADCQQIYSTLCCDCELRDAAGDRGELKGLQNPGEDDNKNNNILAVTTEKYQFSSPSLEKQYEVIFLKSVSPTHFGSASQTYFASQFLGAGFTLQRSNEICFPLFNSQYYINCK